MDYIAPPANLRVEDLPGNFVHITWTILNAGVLLNWVEVSSDRLFNKIVYQNAELFEVSVYLNFSGTYFLRVQSLSEHYAWSDWSETISFQIERSGWVPVGLPHSSEILCSISYKGLLFAGTKDPGQLLRWEGTSWEIVADQHVCEGQIICLVEYEGFLYAGTGPDSSGLGGGALLKWNGSNAWDLVAEQSDLQKEIRCLYVFKEKLFGGTSSGGCLFLLEPGGSWKKVASKKNNQTVIHSMVSYNGFLYASTGGVSSEGGNLFKWDGTGAWEIRASLNLDLGLYLDIRSLFIWSGSLYGDNLKWDNIDSWVDGFEGIGIPLVHDNRLYGIRDISPYGCLKLFDPGPEQEYAPPIFMYERGVMAPIKMVLGFSYNDEIYAISGGPTDLSSQYSNQMFLYKSSSMEPPAIVFREAGFRRLNGPNIIFD